MTATAERDFDDRDRKRSARRGAASARSRVSRARPDRRRRSRYSTAVRWLRLGLPLAAAGVLAAVFFDNRTEVSGEFLLRTIDVAALESGMRLTNPRFTGSTPAGEPFVLTASAAQPDQPNPTEIELTDVDGSIKLSDGRNVAIRSNEAMLEPKPFRVRANGDVRLTTSDGYRFETSALELDSETREIRSLGPVFADGPVGAIRADGMRLKDDGGLIAWFEGGVRMTIVKLADPVSR